MAGPRVPGLRDSLEPPCGEQVHPRHLDRGMRSYDRFCGHTHAADCVEDGQVGYALVWVSEFDPRHPHEVAVELLVELMDRAVGHADDAARELGDAPTPRSEHPPDRDPSLSTADHSLHPTACALCRCFSL